MSAALSLAALPHTPDSASAPPPTPLSPTGSSASAPNDSSPMNTTTAATTTTNSTSTTNNSTSTDGGVKRKASRRANTAERRATHNAVERQRRETLNGRFLDLAALLPNLATVRRPSKSAIVNSSIALIHSHRRARATAGRELRTLEAESDALRREVNEWRARSGAIPALQSPARSPEFIALVNTSADDADTEEERRAYALVEEEEEEEDGYGGGRGEGGYGAGGARREGYVAGAGVAAGVDLAALSEQVAHARAVQALAQQTQLAQAQHHQQALSHQQHQHQQHQIQQQHHQMQQHQMQQQHQQHQHPRGLPLPAGLDPRTLADAEKLAQWNAAAQLQFAMAQAQAQGGLQRDWAQHAQAQTQALFTPPSSGHGPPSGGFDGGDMFASFARQPAFPSVTPFAFGLPGSPSSAGFGSPPTTGAGFGSPPSTGVADGDEHAGSGTESTHGSPASSGSGGEHHMTSVGPVGHPTHVGNAFGFAPAGRRPSLSVAHSHSAGQVPQYGSAGAGAGAGGQFAAMSMLL